jgi:hypothetical protein
MLTLLALGCKPAPPLADTSPQPGDSNAEVSFSIDHATYVAGQSVGATLTSHSTDTLGFNQCANRTIEARDGEEWRKYEEPGRICTMELRLLKPDETQTLTMALPSALPAGRYRITIAFSRQRISPPSDSGAVTAVSPTFAVERP